MAFWKKLLGGGSPPPEPEPEVYKGFSIYAEPVNEGSRWRLAGRIEKEIGGELRAHRLIRADTFESEEAAARETVAKAQMVIDQQGDRLFH